MTYKVTYTKKIGGEGSIIVKARSEEEAISNAKHLCFTGRNFKDAVQVDDSLYTKPRNKGFYGSVRANK